MALTRSRTLRGMRALCRTTGFIGDLARSLKVTQPTLKPIQMLDIAKLQLVLSPDSRFDGWTDLGY